MQEGLTAAGPRPIPVTGPSRIVANRRVGPGWHLLRLREPAIAQVALPGQFVQVLCAERGAVDPLLRRPFSIYDVDPEAGTYDILYTPVGRGTRWMAELPSEARPGQETVDVIGPFGNTFSPPGAREEVILVGGGVGIAPLYFFARRLRGLPRPPEVLLLVGARTAAQLQGIDDFRKLGVRCETATDDGSAGFFGFVTGLLESILDARPAAPSERCPKVYGCGPPGMNEALRKVAVERGIPCEICLESRMACGFGICFGCVAPIRKEVDGPFYNRRICWEGPVFDARLLKGD
jgi:dihydroorotate dehydrogenase electron transfer subunit